MVGPHTTQDENQRSMTRHTHKEITAEKLKVHIPAQTPSGSLMQQVSTPLDALGTNSPIWRLAIPQACSTTSTSRQKKLMSLIIFLLFGVLSTMITFPSYNIGHGNITYITNLNHEERHFLQKSMSSPALYKYSWSAYPENKLILFNAVKFTGSNKRKTSEKKEKRIVQLQYLCE